MHSSTFSHLKPALIYANCLGNLPIRRGSARFKIDTKVRLTISLYLPPVLIDKNCKNCRLFG